MSLPIASVVEPLAASELSTAYRDALLYLFSTARYDGRGQKYLHPERSQARMREILERLGNPQQRFQAIHITGTKGKGSTSAYAESILRHLGYRTGLFTSPHLHTFRERVRIDGQLMTKEELPALIERLRPHFEEIPDLSVFDKITALAFQHFADAGVDWAVVEVGLGGRLDSTNVLMPRVCGITRISKDHMHVLGDTLAEIAYEKAGIIKPGVPVFVSPQRSEPHRVLAETAAARHAPIHWVAPLRTPPAPLFGRHQQINAAVAWRMIEDLAQRGELPHYDEDKAAAGLAATWWPGRFELLPDAGTTPLLVDCAHNVDSINILCTILRQKYRNRPVTFIFGANRDKRMRPMVEHLLDVSPRLVLVQSRHAKALSTQEILREIQPWLAKHDPRASVILEAASMTEAVTVATSITPPDGLLVGTGSVFVTAELREAWNVLHPNAFPPTDWVHQAADEPDLNVPMRVERAGQSARQTP
ncbi:MAG: folylpolyglutamate synthase/dihydrofolate synthase family protein [Caldilineaceae bacterium]